MTSPFKLQPLALATLFLFTATPSMAQDAGWWYVGAGVGTARAKLDEQGITQGVLGVPATSFDSDRRATAGRFFGGYQIHRNVAVEAGYFDLGRYSLNATVPGGTLASDLRVKGFDLGLVGTLPLTERLSALARLGVQTARTENSFRTTGLVTTANPTSKDRDTNGMAGVGLQYAFTPSLLMRGEVGRYRVADGVGQHADVNVVSVSLVIPFGRSAAPAPRAMVMSPTVVSQAPPPAPVYTPAPAPAPAPVVMAPPAPVAAAPAAEPTRQRVSFSAESLFSFDQAAVKPEGMAALDGFTKQVEGTRFEQITVEGHTDRLGSTTYNQDLSQQRADSVKSYLVTTGKMDPSKITAVARGESMPVTKAGDCVGETASARLIACLQPDRRVDVDVTGTR